LAAALNAFSLACEHDGDRLPSEALDEFELGQSS
jgi:hypothetical protein